MLPRRKISIIGAGDIGLNLAEILALQGYNIVLYNRPHSDPNGISQHWLSKQGFIMDLNDSLQMPRCGVVKLTADLQDLVDSEIIVITAGTKRTSANETRDELAVKNAKIIENFIDVAIDNPTARLLIISNPVDLLTQFFIHAISDAYGVPIKDISKRVFGVSYIDTMRLRNIVKEVLLPRIPDIDQAFVEGIALGEHGPTMVPLMSHVKIDGTNLSDIANKEEIEQIFLQTVLRGNDIIKLTGMSSVTGPAHAAFFMIDQLLNYDKVTLTCSAFDGIRSLGRNVVFYKGYLDHIEDTYMTPEEQKLLHKSEKALDEQYKRLINSFMH